MKLSWKEIEMALTAAYGQEGQEQVEEFREWEGLLNYYRQCGDSPDASWDLTRGEVPT